MPEKELADLDELKEILSEDEYNEVVKSMEGKFRKVDKPLMTGGILCPNMVKCWKLSVYWDNQQVYKIIMVRNKL